MQRPVSCVILLHYVDVSHIKMFQASYCHLEDEFKLETV